MSDFLNDVGRMFEENGFPPYRASRMRGVFDDLVEGRTSKRYGL